MFSAMVSGVDIAIGQIVDQLKQEGLYEDSIILFSSDVSLLIMRNHKYIFQTLNLFRMEEK